MPGCHDQGESTDIEDAADQPILSSIGELQRFEPDDYHIALVPRPKGKPSTVSAGQPLTMDRVFVLPLTWRELLERMGGQLNSFRSSDQATILQFGEVQVNFFTLQIIKSEKLVVLTAQLFKLLRFLTQAPKQHSFQRVRTDEPGKLTVGVRGGI